MNPRFLKVCRLSAYACVLGLFAVGATTAFAEDRGGERPATYMQMGFGGRQVAMGGAGTALTGGLASGLWNPANLTGVRTFQFYTQYAFLSQDRTLAFLSLGNKLERSPLSYAISWAYFSAGDDLEYRYGPSLEPVYLFSDSQMAFVVSTAYRLDARYSVGLNVKTHTHWIAESFGWGLGADLGFLARVGDATKIGFSVQDPISGVKFENSDSGRIPPSVKGGVSHLIWKPQITLSADLVYGADLGLEPHLGIEWMPGYGIGIRAGWAADHLTAGFGIIARSRKLVQEFNYVLAQDVIEEGEFLHRISLGLRFL
jgi:hypothetical protein